MLKIIGGIFVLVILAVVILALFQPKEFRVERSVVINSEASAIFPYLNNPRKMNEWNPWVEKDPNAKATFEGPEEGVGAKNAWEGNREVGVGSAVIIESIPNELVKVQLNFLEPMRATHFTSYILTPEGAATKLTWAMEGKNNFFSRILCIFLNMDKMVGPTFEKGLLTLKSKVENK